MRGNKFQVINLALSICLLIVLCGNTLAVDQWFDSYGHLPWDEEKLHLDNFAIHLKQNPNMKGYIVFYIGKDIDAKEASTRIARVKDYLLCTRDVDPMRIVIVDKGSREKTRTILQPVLADKQPPDFAD